MTDVFCPREKPSLKNELLHFHKWFLRDDGKYECDCDLIVLKEDLNNDAKIPRLLRIGRYVFQLEFWLGDSRFLLEGTKKEIEFIYSHIIGQNYPKRSDKEMTVHE